VRSLIPVALALLLVTCGGAPAAVETPSPSPTPTATPAPSAAGAAWTVSDKSKATVRVREQLVGVNFPSDAVLTVKGAAGTFLLTPDGTFTSDSKITFDLTTLSSDQRDRDNFITRDTLQVRQFPKAELVPTKVTGVTFPLPASGDFTFTLAGRMTIRGTTKDVAFDVKATRAGGDLTATATANPTWTFEDFGMRPPTVPFRVVSVSDEIRLVVELVATGPSA
jgi:polyisoprenoid-binding protein YceI